MTFSTGLRVRMWAVGVCAGVSLPIFIANLFVTMSPRASYLPVALGVAVLILLWPEIKQAFKGRDG